MKVFRENVVLMKSMVSQNKLCTPSTVLEDESVPILTPPAPRPLLSSPPPLLHPTHLYDPPLLPSFARRIPFMSAGCTTSWPQPCSGTRTSCWQSGGPPLKRPGLPSPAPCSSARVKRVRSGSTAARGEKLLFYLFKKIILSPCSILRWHFAF